MNDVIGNVQPVLVAGSESGTFSAGISGSCLYFDGSTIYALPQFDFTILLLHS